MTLAGRAAEHERIRAAYAYYDASKAEQRKREDANPGNRLNAAGRWAALRQAITGLHLPACAAILDMGCGAGGDLRAIARDFGHLRPSLHGVDLLPCRIAQARDLLPQAVLRVSGGDQLGYPDRSFDLVLACTVFSSVLDVSLAREVAAEMTRVARGTIVCYDMRYPNPRNPHTRPIRRADLRDLFPGARIGLTTVTLLPPLARGLGPLAGPGYRPLHAVRLLRSHYLAEIRPARPPESTG